MFNIFTPAFYERRVTVARIKKFVIRGCEAHGNGDRAYLIRWTLWERAGGWQFLLHKFVADDHTRELHDHPWWFVTLILWRGYREHLPGGIVKRRWPGMILFRRATHQHSVTLVDGKSAWTCVLTGSKSRTWGFWVDKINGKGFMDFRTYFRERGC